MEVVCDLDLRIWSLFFGLPGMLNDLNIIRLSPFFAEVLTDQFPPMIPNYTVSGETFDFSYFLADGIYVDYKFLVTTITEPQLEEESFSEGDRKGSGSVLSVCLKCFIRDFKSLSNPHACGTRRICT